MADDAVIRLGYDNSKVRAGAMETQAIMSKTAKGVEKTMSGMGGKSKGGADWKNVSYQIQDVAVQMQMGTKAATIFAQQGSQVASAFGPAGVAIGATIAVVGGLYTAGSKTNEMFDEMISNVGLLKKESESLAKVGGMSEMVSQTQKIADAQEEMIKAMEKLGTVSGRSIALLGQATGGDSPEERKNQLAKGFNDLLEVRKSIVKTILDLSGKEVEIEELKAQGNQDAVEEAQRQLDLKRKIAQIKQQPFSDETKSQLIGNEQKKSGFEAEAKKRIKYEKEQQEEESKRAQEADAMAQAQRQYADAQLERITDAETGQEKVNRLTQEYNNLLDEAAKYSASSVQYIEKSAAAQSKENELMREKKKLAEEAKEEALSNAQFMDNFRANRQNIRAGDAEKAKQEQAGNTEFMNDFRVRRDSLRWQERDREEAAQGMQSAFDGNRRTIKGYTGGLKEGRLAQDTGRLSKDTGLLGGGTFNEFFKPRDAAKSGAFKSGMTTNTRTHQGGAGGKPEEKLLTRIADSIESLAAN
jgi:hypothetical protein